MPDALVDDAFVADTFVDDASADEVLRDKGLRGDGLLAAVLRDEVPADVLDGDALDGDVLDDDLFVDEALVEDALGMDCATLSFPHDVHGSGPSLAEGVTCRLDSGSTMPRRRQSRKHDNPRKSMAREDYDVLIIGGGHNGLVCATYLGMAGLKVKVLERRAVVGGAAVTEEFHPGFRNSVAAYTVSLLNPKIIRDLRLAEHGLRIVERRAHNFLPAPDGRYLLVSDGQTERHIAEFSRADAERFQAFNQELDACADVLRMLILQAPPNLSEGLNVRSIGQLLKLGVLGNHLRNLSTENLRTLYDLFTKSAGDYLDGWFEGDLLKALLGFDAVVGNYASPYTPGTAYVLLHHAFGEVNGKKRTWGHAIGGMGAITQAMAKAAASHGVEIETNAAVREVIVELGRVRGVVLTDGRSIRGNAVAANVNPKLLYTSLVPSGALPTDFLRRMQRWRCGSGTFRMNVALSTLPSFTARPGTELADHHTSGIILAPSLRLHGASLCRCPTIRLEPRADHRDAHPFDARRHARPKGRACGEPVLPARGTRTACPCRTLFCCHAPASPRWT